MSRNATPAGLPTRRLLLLLLVAVLVTQGLAAAEAGAAGKRRVSVTRVLSASTALTGDTIAVGGRVSPARPGTAVALQRYSRGRWGTVKRSRVNSERRYRFTITSTSASGYRYRVISAAGARYRAGTSASFVARFLTCTRMSAPYGGRAAWFTRPGLRSTSPMTTALSRLFCSAARGATINVSMYYMRSGSSQPEASTILRSLERVSRYRGVKVRVMVEGRLYRPGSSMRATLTALQKYATVVQCHLGCRNEGFTTEAKGAILHHKFITVSDLTWASGKDPAVVMSSANWSQSQLRHKWQSAVLAYRDAALHREVEAQWGVLDACASRGGCASWNATLAKLSLSPDSHGVASRNRVWHDLAEVTERQGGAGSGLGVTFSPTLATDPVAAALRQYTCTPEHRTVRVAHMFLTSARLAVARALGELQAKGCSVHVVLAHRGEARIVAVGLLRDLGVQVSCTPKLHDKAVLVDAVRTEDGRPDKLVLMGSQSLSGAALRSNDESLLRLSSHDARGSAVSANTAVWNAYSKHWSSIYAHRESCS